MQITSENILYFAINYINIWSPILVLLVGLLSWRTYRQSGSQAVLEKMLGWYLFFTVGLLSLHDVIMDFYYPEFSAHVKGIAASAFQYDVGSADLIFVALGFAGAFTKNYGFRCATVIGYSIWLWSETLKHIYLVTVLHTTSPYYTGATAYIDAVLPILGIILVLGSRRQTAKECFRSVLRRWFRL
jgi:hypothetical protein